MTDSLSDDLLLRYLAGECSAAEAVGIAERVASDARLREELDALRVASAAWSNIQSDGDEAAAWAAMRRRVVATPVAAPSLWRWPSVALAAASVLVAVFGVSAWWMAARHVGQQAFHEFSTASGNRTTVTLRDGTRIVLAPSTHIRVPVDFGLTATRTLDLDGEAYLAVVHDATHPFEVRAHGTVIRDIGTAFDVRAYPERAAVQVAVVSGEVAVGSARAYAGDVATVSGTNVSLRHGVDVASLVSWMQGGLVFADTPLRDVVQDVARTFGVQITIADSTLASKPITATFKDEPVNEVLEVITQAVGARYDRTGRRIVIRRESASVPPRLQHTPTPLSTASSVPVVDVHELSGTVKP